MKKAKTIAVIRLAQLSARKQAIARYGWGWGSMTRAALWLSQQSAYAPDAFLREPERDLPFFLSPSDINTLEAKQANRL